MRSLLLLLISKIKNNKLIVSIILASLVLRTLYALCIDFDEFSELYFADYTQIYLLGLKFYTTQSWPYWGPDITYTASQMPGAMQGLLVGLPFFIFESPYAPFIFLNVISVTALVFFGWYVSKRITGIPKWFIYAWLLSAPWTTNFSTTVVNPSYVLAPAILFFTGLIELLPIYKQKILSTKTSFFFMGFAIGWIMQLYMSWMLLPFYVLLGFFFVFKQSGFKTTFIGALYFLFGFLITVSVLLPTFLKYGFATGGSESAISFNPSNFKNIDVITRFIAFSTYEAFHFMSGALVDEKTLFLKYWWGTPIIAVLFVIGMAQTIFYMSYIFRKTDRPEFKGVKFFVIGSVVFIYVTYLFTVRDMASYTFYMLLPVSFWFSFYCLEGLFRKAFWKKFAMVFLFCGLIYHLALAKGFYPTNSLFIRKDKIVDALSKKDSRLFAYRRVAKWEEKERMKFWIKTTAGDTDKYSNSFDNYTNDILPETLTKDIFATSPYSCLIDSSHQYSINFVKPLEDIRNKRKVKITFTSLGNGMPEANVCINITRKDSSLFWWSEKLKVKAKPAYAWEQNTFETEIPDLNITKAKFEVFVSLAKSKSNPKLYIDNFAVELYR